ncbi:hypothetical protein [Embleya scabrispora]|uniref:hypothetical protein n=1 Tax=Embleya scabrispora TaxID=159449 RepID=UPI0003A70073|nr:hypothetical protein [Embleya scabrispora]MYS87767.1 hypothetical protein [Streptomyces sp. SID5474]
MGDDVPQSLVDELSERPGCSVAIDNVGIRPLAASWQFCDEDTVPVTSVLHRAVPADLTERVPAQGRRLDRPRPGARPRPGVGPTGVCPSAAVA